MKKENEMVKDIAGIMIAVAVFVIYAALMLKYTKRDMLEILVSYMAFLAVPSFSLPRLLGRED